MSMKSKIAIAILAVFFIVVSFVLWRNFDNLKALYLLAMMDEEAIAQQMDDTRREHQQVLEKEHAVIVQAPSREQSDDLLDGKVTAGEVKESIGISDSNLTVETPAPKSREELANNCTAELYALKIDVMEELGSKKQSLYDRWNALPAKERTKEKKLELGFAALDDCYNMEIEVDRRVKEILSKYRKELSAIGADTELMNILWKQYCEEKASEKAFYLNKYL